MLLGYLEVKWNDKVILGENDEMDDLLVTLNSFLTGVLMNYHKSIWSRALTFFLLRHFQKIGLILRMLKVFVQIEKERVIISIKLENQSISRHEYVMENRTISF
ncbi:hypothetical protein BTS2_2971 [Bacillus sp. TS-2]|nr:hypothetical protein BTS2_2971 [Bacillus sp. TS-2]